MEKSYAWLYQCRRLDIFLDEPYIPTKEVKYGDLTTTVVKTKKYYNEADRKKIKKNYYSKRFLSVGLGQMSTTEFLRVRLVKKIWNCLQKSHEGTPREWTSQSLTCSPLSTKKILWSKIKPSWDKFKAHFNHQWDDMPRRAYPYLKESPKDFSKYFPNPGKLRWISLHKLKMEQLYLPMNY